MGRSGNASFKACRAGVRCASREIGNWAAPRWQHTNGYLVSKNNKEGIEIVLQVQTLSQHGTIHHDTWERKEEKREYGWHRHYGLSHHRCQIHHGLLAHTTTGMYGRGGIRIVHDGDG